MLCIAEEAARGWVAGCSELERGWVPRCRPESWLGLMHEVEVLRLPLAGGCTQTQAKIRSIWTDPSVATSNAADETLDKASTGPCSCPCSAGGGWGAGAPTTASEWLP